ncbi:N-acetyltransferase [Rhizocola hellebori]|uniref:N-acetyltransferase n=1 Tax=Rhizocola hellebori TaxID=1392758 RepID=A0A8J3QD37_9ACTN|nr:GNAT family N-acetyltransferase [Rhizocola hellebori]GIH08460.1 N-acetyltransferase [Rhizocola hellebori]
MSITLRQATAADVAAVLAFWRIAAENTNRSDSARAIQELITRDPQALLIAVHDEQIVGSVIAGWDGWRCHLYRFAVHPARRRQGIGRLLLDAAEQRFVALGGHRADAMVLNDNELGINVWAAAGYAPQSDCARWVKPLTLPHSSNEQGCVPD